MRRSIFTQFCTVIVMVKTFLSPINSLAARGHRKFVGKRPHRGKLFIILSFIELKQPNVAVVCRLRTSVNPVNFVRIVQGTRRLRVIILVKFYFTFWGRKPTPLSHQGKIWQGGADRLLLPAKFHSLIGATCLPCGAKNPKINS